MSAPVILVAIVFALIGGASERLASVWPAEEASHRRPGLRTVLLSLAAAGSAGMITWRANLPAWAVAADLALLGLLVVLTATDLDQRRLPHRLLDPLIVGAIAFVPFNPTVTPLNAVIGAVSAVAFLGLLGLLVRGGVAAGDLYLVVPLGLLVGWPSIFVALFVAALLSAAAGVALLVTGRAGMKSYIPFGPFLVAGTVITLLREPALLGNATAGVRALLALLT